jgi:hypothetical protein
LDDEKLVFFPSEVGIRVLLDGLADEGFGGFEVFEIAGELGKDERGKKEQDEALHGGD